MNGVSIITNSEVCKTLMPLLMALRLQTQICIDSQEHATHTEFHETRSITVNIDV